MILFLALIDSPAHACSMARDTYSHLELPGEIAGPQAVFTADGGTELLDPAGVAVEVSRMPLLLGDGEAVEILAPVAPLAPGDYTLSPCSTMESGTCTTTIVEGAGDPGILPATPTISLERTHVLDGRQADCGPRVPARVLTATRDAVAVVFAEEPAADLLDLEPIAVAAPDEVGNPSWTTTWDGTVFAAAIDAEGEISEWTDAIDVQSHGCSTSGSARAGALLALLAIRTRSPRRGRTAAPPGTARVR